MIISSTVELSVGSGCARIGEPAARHAPGTKVMQTELRKTSPPPRVFLEKIRSEIEGQTNRTLHEIDRCIEVNECPPHQASPSL